MGKKIIVYTAQIFFFKRGLCLCFTMVFDVGLNVAHMHSSCSDTLKLVVTLFEARVCAHTSTPSINL